MNGPRAAAAVLLAVGFGATFLSDPWQHEEVSDIPLYRGYAELFHDGVLPYRDIDFEYPPLAAPLLALPGLASLDLSGYRVAFAAVAFLLALGLVLATGRVAALTGGSERRVLLAAALAPLATGAMLRTHFDLAPVLCLVGGLGAVGAGRWRLGFVLLGVGTAIKLFPLAAALVAAAWLTGRGSGREAARGLTLALAVAGVAVGTALVLSPQGAWDSVSYHLERPVQVESLPATALNALDAGGARTPEPVSSHRSDGLEHPAAEALTIAFAVLLAAAVAALALAATQARDRRALVLAGLGSAAALAAFGKVLSPQFMIWLVPLAALAWGWRMHALAVATTATIATTMLWFPQRYFDLVARDTGPLVAVTVRNALFLVVLGLLAAELARAVRAPRAAARSTPPAHPAALRSAPR